MAYISANVLMIEAGMAMAEMIVVRQFHRKISTTSAARMLPSLRCSFTASVLALMYSDWSRVMMIL